MIDRAALDFNLARQRSWLIGDTSVEVETARRAGLKSILVETGYAGLDYRVWATPDAIVPDLGAAVSFILERYPRLLARCGALAKNIGAGALVLVGGQSRSGKSTVAGALRDALRSRGLGALVLSADRWLRSEKERTPGVLGRFDMPALQAVVDTVAGGGERPGSLTLPGYHKLKRERLDAVETVRLLPSDVIIVEGVVALALEPPTTAEVHRFHVDIDENERKQRVLREYRLRGFAEDRALALYLARRAEEAPVIESLAARGHRIASTDYQGTA